MCITSAGHSDSVGGHMWIGGQSDSITEAKELPINQLRNNNGNISLNVILWRVDNAKSGL